MSFRKEKKFRLTISDMQFLKKRLLLKGMTELYQKRKVKSNYFDTFEMRMFHDSDEGILPRKKVRIRSYNDQKNFTKELKITSEEGRYKQSSTILNNSSCLNDFKKLLDNSYGVLTPSLFVSYYREYYSFYNLRITFDSSIKYKSLRIKLPLEIRDPECVMEIKTPINVDDDFISKVISMPSSRFSKYCRGIIMTN